jgi:ABC-type amino acid transport substrate-binding protein
LIYKPISEEILFRFKKIGIDHQINTPVKATAEMRSTGFTSLRIQLKVITFAIGLVLLSSGWPACAAESEQILKVGISPFSPFVMLSEDGPRGCSIDYWKKLAELLKTRYEFVECTGVADKLKRLAKGEIDIAIGGITITEERETQFDFTQPTFRSGLDILIRADRHPGIVSLVASMFEKNKLTIFLLLALLIVIAGHLIWLAERSNKKWTTKFHRNYFPGVLDGMYWALVTASTVGYGDFVPKKWIGKALSGILIILFLPLFGFLIASLSSELTLYNLKMDIQGPEDLIGKQVGVIKGTTSDEYMRKGPSELFKFEDANQMYKALEVKAVDAVVYDAPVLRYYAKTKGKGKVEVVGKLFDKQYYGIAIQQGSALREEINRDLLALEESGETAAILEKWFGKGHSL